MINKRWKNSFWKMWRMKKFILWNVRDEKIYFMKCEGLWIELYKIWFDNFALKIWSRARHVVNSDKKLVGNLSRDQIWPMWICKGCKITFLKMRDEKSYFTKCEGRFERFFLINIMKKTRKELVCYGQFFFYFQILHLY